MNQMQPHLSNTPRMQPLEPDLLGGALFQGLGTGPVFFPSFGKWNLELKKTGTEVEGEAVFSCLPEFQIQKADNYFTNVLRSDDRNLGARWSNACVN